MIDEGVDTGAIVLQRKFEMNLDENVRWHQKLVEGYACQMQEEILFTLDNTNSDSKEKGRPLTETIRPQY